VTEHDIELIKSVARTEGAAIAVLCIAGPIIVACAVAILFMGA